jgi:hypothetical protein
MGVHGTSKIIENTIRKISVRSAVCKAIDGEDGDNRRIGTAKAKSCLGCGMNRLWSCRSVYELLVVRCRLLHRVRAGSALTVVAARSSTGWRIELRVSKNTNLEYGLRRIGKQSEDVPCGALWRIEGLKNGSLKCSTLTTVLLGRCKALLT